MTTPLLSMRGITKRYDGVPVLNNVDFDLAAGEIHALAGENGAGKSTLIKILSGAVSPNAGEMRINGEIARFHTPRDAAAQGIAVIYQELSLVGPMSVAENISLGRERGMLYQRRRLETIAAEALRELGVTLDTALPVESLTLGVRQLVEIARALHAHAQILVMDEPTSALNAVETERLLSVMRHVAARGAGIVFISHRHDEIAKVANRITVLRNGNRVDTAAASTWTNDTLIRAMVGREITQQYPPRNADPGNSRMDVVGLNIRDGQGRTIVNNVALNIRSGEILGLAGLQGSGTSEVLLALAGAYGKRAKGRIVLDGESIVIHSPRDAIKRGIVYTGGDRATTGVIRPMSIAENISLAALPRFSRGGWIQRRTEEDESLRLAEESGVHVRTLRAAAGSLSGGNQQKILFARARATIPRLVLLDDPTRGVDIGVKQELYALMNAWTAAGCAIILASSDLSELLGMSDRIMVLRNGACGAEFPRGIASADAVMRAAVGKAAA